MDPLSFVASLVTVGTTVAASSAIIYNLCKKFKDVTDDAQSLSERLNLFKGLLKELEVQL